MAATKIERAQLGKLETVEATHTESGATVTVALLGATVVSFKSGDGKERLFLSNEAVLDGSKPIRGGVPLVFPQFGGGKLQSHGFARNSTWNFVEPQVTETEAGAEPSAKKQKPSEFSELVFELSANEETRAMWPHDFALVYTVRFNSSKLETSLCVRNIGSEVFDFQALLHTYYALDEVETTTITGLDGLSLMDQLQDRKESVEERKPITIEQETDAIYKAAKGAVNITCNDKETAIEVELTSSDEVRPCDIVLWNPWVDKSKRTADFGDEEYHKMVCVEPGCVSRFEQCLPGDSWTLSQRITFN